MKVEISDILVSHVPQRNKLDGCTHFFLELHLLS